MNRLAWFWSFKPSMYVRYYYDKDGILRREIKPNA